MTSFLRHTQRLLRTLQDFGLQREKMEVGSNLPDDFDIGVVGDQSFLYIDFETPSFTLCEETTLDDLCYDFSEDERHSFLKTLGYPEERIMIMNHPEATFDREIQFSFGESGFITGIEIDAQRECRPAIKEVKRRYPDLSTDPWEIQKLYDKLNNGNYSTVKRTETAIDALVETALRINIISIQSSHVKAAPLKEHYEEITGRLKRIEAYLLQAPKHQLVSEEEGLRQLYLRRIVEGQFLVFNRRGVQFPYVLATRDELGSAGRIVDTGLYFVATDAAPEPWQKEIIAYHEYVEGRKNHAAAVRTELGLARELGISQRQYYSWVRTVRGKK